MQINITLSKKEKRHYFLYLLGMLVFTVFIVAFIVLNKVANPFSGTDMHAVMTLQDKAKFDEAQKNIQKQMDSTFVKIEKMNPEKITPIEENDISVGISNVNNAFKMSASSDPRKESYPQVAKFYEMFFEDKKNTVTLKKNIENFTKQYDNCIVGYRDRQQQMMQR